MDRQSKGLPKFLINIYLLRMRDLHQIDGSFVLLAAKGDEWVSKWCRVGKNITMICGRSDHQIESDYLV